VRAHLLGGGWTSITADVSREVEVGDACRARAWKAGDQWHMSENKPEPTTVMKSDIHTKADGSHGEGRERDASPSSLTCLISVLSASISAASSRCSAVVWSMQRIMSLSPQPLHGSLSPTAAADANRASMSSSPFGAAAEGAGGANGGRLAAAAFLLVSTIACSSALRRGSPEVK
jgi:hypothetical protein